MSICTFGGVEADNGLAKIEVANPDDVMWGEECLQKIDRAVRSERPGQVNRDSSFRQYRNIKFVAFMIDPKLYQPELPLPEGFTRQQILDALMTLSIDGGAMGELENYACEDCDRFLHTLSLVPEGPIRILEIGANPYFLTYLLKTFRPQAEISLINYFGGEAEPRSQMLTADALVGESPVIHSFDFQNVNIEDMALPFAKGSFDLVLYCEVLEHMTNDPVATLLKIKNVLKPEGQLVVTTPNVARLENVARLIAGSNIYDPYSGYGPYGRHNREYSRHELHHLLRYCGFAEELFFTADVHPNRVADYLDPLQLEGLLARRRHDLGQYLFTRCRNATPAGTKLPAWLYRSYPSDRIDGNENL